MTHGYRNMCEREGHTSNSGSSSKIRWVAEVSSLCSNERGGNVFLLLPQVLLEGGASTDGHGAAGLDLPMVGHLLKLVRTEGGEEPYKTMLPMEGRPPLKGTISK